MLQYQAVVPMNSVELIFLLIFLSVVQGQEFQFSQVKLKGACPRITYATDVDLSRIIGWYYRVFSNLNNSLCYKNEGQTMYAAQYNVTHITVNMCCRSAADTTVAVCGADIGSGYVIATTTPGQFIYEYLDNMYPAFVLDTDYESYTIIYGCKPGSRSNQRDEVLYIYSRDYMMSNIYQDRVRSVLEKNNIQWFEARPVKQGPTIPYNLFAKECH